MKTKVAHIIGGGRLPERVRLLLYVSLLQTSIPPLLKTGRELYDTMRFMERMARDNGEALSGSIFIDEK